VPPPPSLERSWPAQSPHRLELVPQLVAGHLAAGGMAAHRPARPVAGRQERAAGPSGTGDGSRSPAAGAFGPCGWESRERRRDAPRQHCVEIAHLDVLLVEHQAEPEHVEKRANEQEGDRTSHHDDPGTCESPLLRGQFLRLHPSRSVVPGPAMTACCDSP
jgi:hypothetical protein